MWQDPDFLRSATEWIDERVTRTGPITQPHVRDWATVLCAPTADGAVFFKANTAALQHEAAVVALLAERRPALVPPLLAVDPDSGWMLMADAGERLREVCERERSFDRWLSILPGYADLQLAVVDDVPALLAAGVPDRRL